MGLAERIRSTRKDRAMTQEDLAHAAGMSLRAYTSLERGEAVDPHISTVRKLAKALDVSPYDLLGEEYVSPKDQAPPPPDIEGEVRGGLDRFLDMEDAEFLRVLETHSNEELVELYQRLDAKRIDTALALQDDETNRRARRDFSRAVSRGMMVFITLGQRGVTLPDPEEDQARKLTEAVELLGSR